MINRQEVDLCTLNRRSIVQHALLTPLNAVHFLFKMDSQKFGGASAPPSTPLSTPLIHMHLWFDHTVYVFGENACTELGDALY